MSRLLLIGIALLVVLVGIRLVLMVFLAPKLFDGHHIAFVTTLLAEPKQGKSSSTTRVWYSNTFGAVPITLSLASGKNFHYGDVVRISGDIKVKVLTNAKAIVTIQNADISLINERRNALLAITNDIRQKIQRLYEKSLSPFFSTLLLGIVLGGSGGFTKSEVSQFQTAGVMHVIAASGMNVTLVSGFLLGVLGAMGFLKRRMILFLTIVLLFLYVCIAGFQASIIRAGIMAAMMLFGQASGRQYSGLYGMFLAAGLMLCINPTLISDVGFQLSFAATLGIFLIKPILPFGKLVHDDIGTSIAAQIATLPILLTSFGTYGLLSILVNALILWTIPILMIIGGIGALVGLVYEPLGRLILITSWPLLFYFQQVIDFFSQFNFNLQIQNLSIFIIIGYYLFLASWVLAKRE